MVRTEVRIRSVWCLALLLTVQIRAQDLAPNRHDKANAIEAGEQSPAASFSERTSPVGLLPSGPHLLGPGDHVTIRALHLEDITPEARRVDEMGDLLVPLLGRVRAAGLSPRELETELVSRLKVYVEGTPEVQVSLVGVRSNPVTVVGAVNRPGTFELVESRSLLEILLMAGGLAKDARPSVRITRRMERGRIPLDDAKIDPSGQFSYVEVDTSGLLQAENAARNVRIEADDVIIVTALDQIYVIGEVVRPGAFSVGEGGKLSALQAMSMASGFTPDAATKNAKIIRPVPGAVRQEIALDLQRILKGELEDPLLKPGDTLYVPVNGGKKWGRAIASAAIIGGVSSAIWMLFRY